MNIGTQNVLGCVAASFNVGAEIKCATGQTVALAEAEAKKRLSGLSAADQLQAARSAIEAGATNPAVTPVVTGPASTPEVVEQTTAPDGTVTTKRSTTTINYNGDTVTYGPTTTTTNIQNTTNNTSSTTTTTTNNSSSSTAVTQADDPCESDPDRVGCLKLGEPPDDEIPTVDRTVDANAEAVALPSGCPAPIQLPGGNSISYATACDSAEKMRPFVLAAASMAGLLIALAAIRGAS